MASSWDLMQHGTAVEYMHAYHSRYHVVHMSHENRGYGMATWPTMPYPEAGAIDHEALEYYTEEHILGILLAIGTPPCLVTPSLMYPKTTDANIFVWRQKLRRLMHDPHALPADSMALINTIKQYLNFEFLRQLGKNDD